MESQKPKSINQIGIIIASIAGLIIMSNTMGAISWKMSGIDEEFNIIDKKCA